MPIDASIPLQARNIKFQMPQEVEANALANLARQQQLQQGQQGMEDKNALRQLLAQASQGGNVDYGQLGKALLPYDSNAGLHFMQLGEQQNQQKQWQARQAGMAGPSPQPGMPQAPAPPDAMPPGQPPMPGQPPVPGQPTGQPPQQVSGVFAMYQNNPNPGVVQMARNGELRLQQGGFKSEDEYNKYMDNILQLDAKFSENRAVAETRAQDSRDLAKARHDDRQTDIAVAAAGRAPREARTTLREGENGPEIINMDTGQSTPITDRTSGQRLGAKPGVGADKALTENQGKATMFGMRATKAHDILGEMSSGPVDDRVERPGTIKRMGEALPWVGEGAGTMLNWTQSAKQQKVEQAQRDFLSATLRLESGATIGEHELANGRTQYFVQPGDSDEVKAQKKANRETVIEGFKVQAGPGAKNIGAGKPPPANRLHVVNPTDGKTYEFKTMQEADEARRLVGAK